MDWSNRFVETVYPLDIGDDAASAEWKFGADFPDGSRVRSDDWRSHASVVS